MYIYIYTVYNDVATSGYLSRSQKPGHQAPEARFPRADENFALGNSQFAMGHFP